MKLFYSILLSILILMQISAQTIIKMEKVNGVFVMPCKVNGLSLKFIFDTGASDVSISLTEALFMLKNGYLDEKDLIGTEKYQIANGDIQEGTKIILRQIEIGNLKLYDVKASVVHSLTAPLLLGQTALSVLGKIEFDYSNNTLKISNGTPNKVNNNNSNESAKKQKAEDYYNRGIAKYDLNDYQGALQDYNKAIEFDSKYADAYCARGNAKSKLKDYHDAIQDHNKAIQLNPAFRLAYYDRGNAEYYLKDYKAAIQDFTKAIQLNPAFAFAYANRGIAKYALGDKKDACLDWSKAGELGDTVAYDNINKYCKSDYINNNTTNTGQTAEEYFKTGTAKYHSEDYKGAIQDFNKSIELNPKYAEPYCNRGVCKAGLGDYHGAIQDYNKAIELNSKFAEAFQNRGNSKSMLEDNKGAIQDYNKAIELDPKYAYAYYNCLVSNQSVLN